MSAPQRFAQEKENEKCFRCSELITYDNGIERQCLQGHSQRTISGDVLVQDKKRELTLRKEHRRAPAVDVDSTKLCPHCALPLEQKSTKIQKYHLMCAVEINRVRNRLNQRLVHARIVRERVCKLLSEKA